MRRAAPIALAIDPGVAPDLDFERLAERVHDGDAHAVQAPRDLVGFLVELAARVQLGQHHLGRGRTGRMRLDGNAPAVTELSMWIQTPTSLQ